MNKKLAFTLIEVLIVIVVIGIISSFIIVSMSSVTNNARIAKGKVFADSLRNSLLMHLVLEWKLDGNANDSWGQKNGTIGGSPTSITSCVQGSCYSLNGSSDYIYIADDDSVFNFGSKMSAFVWAKGGSQDSRGLFCQFNYGVGINERSWAIRPYSIINSKLEVILTDTGSGDTVKNYRTQAVVFDNTWHLYGFTWNSGSLKLYVDGVEETNPLIYKDDPFTSIHNSNASLSVGSFFASGSPAGFFNGQVDEARLYNETIPTSQIQQNYYSGLNKLMASGNIDKNEYRERMLLSEK